MTVLLMFGNVFCLIGVGLVLYGIDALIKRRKRNKEKKEKDVK